MWIKTTDSPPIDNCLAFDAVGKTIGIWDGYTFDSITGSYSFDAEYCEDMVFYVEGTNEVCGAITHWAAIPEFPKDYPKVKRALLQQVKKCKKCKRK